MPYSLIDIEITDPIPDLTVPETSEGFALIVRRKQRPIGFLMERLTAGTVLSPHDLGNLLGRRLGLRIVQDCIHEELAAPGKPVRLPSITIAICSKDRTDNLRRCLHSLSRLQESLTEGAFTCEILVVDNAPSNNETRDLVSSTPGVRYLLEPKPGLDFARNCALNGASGELIAYLDDDVTVDSCWLDGLCEAWNENPDAAAFTGLVLPYELRTDAQVLFERRGGFRRGFEKLRHTMDLREGSLSPFGAGIFGAGCNMAFRRDVMLELGGFDEALDTGRPLPGGGDLDAFYRIVRNGHILVYEPRFMVFHQHRQGMEELRRQYWTWGLGFMAYVSKSYQADPASRSRFRQLVWWWFVYMGKQLRKALTSRDMQQASMLWSEFSGGVAGLLGEYRRSMKRIERIRKQHP